MEVLRQIKVVLRFSVVGHDAGKFAIIMEHN